MEGLQHDLVISRIFSPTVSSTDERRDTAERKNTMLRAKCLMQLYGRLACPPGAATRLYGMVVTFAVWYCYTMSQPIPPPPQKKKKKKKNQSEGSDVSSSKTREQQIRQQPQCELLPSDRCLFCEKTRITRKHVENVSQMYDKNS